MWGDGGVGCKGSEVLIGLCTGTKQLVGGSFGVFLGSR